EAADERANAAAKAYQKKQEPRRGPGFSSASDGGAALAGAMALQADATASAPVSKTAPAPATAPAAPLWADASDLLDGLDDSSTGSDAPLTLEVTLSSAEQARLRD